MILNKIIYNYLAMISQDMIKTLMILVIYHSSEVYNKISKVLYMKMNKIMQAYLEKQG